MLANCQWKILDKGEGRYKKECLWCFDVLIDVIDKLC